MTWKLDSNELCIVINSGYDGNYINNPTVASLYIFRPTDQNALKFDFSRDAKSLTTKGRIEGYEINHMVEAKG